MRTSVHGAAQRRGLQWSSRTPGFAKNAAADIVFVPRCGLLMVNGLAMMVDDIYIYILMGNMSKLSDY